MKETECTNTALYWNVEDKTKLEGLKCEFLMDRI